MLVHNYDRQMELQQNQLTYIRQAQTALRRAAPLMSELLNRVGPNVPNYEYLYEPRQLLSHMQQRMIDQESIVTDAFLLPPTPFIPDDDYGYLRRPEPHIPAPMLRRSLYPRSRSAQPTTCHGDQPWHHVEAQDFTVFQAWRTAARTFIRTDEALRNFRLRPLIAICISAVSKRRPLARDSLCTPMAGAKPSTPRTN